MSELANIHRASKTFRWHLLATVSTLATIAAIAPPAYAETSSEDRPTVWIELGGQLERIDGGPQAFLPPFTTSMPRPDYEKVSPADAQRSARYGFGGEARISFQPAGTDWRLSASVLYGRSNAKRHVQQGSAYTLPNPIQPSNPAQGYIYQEVKTTQNESHVVADFRAGKDVGLGLFGANAQTTFGLGVRYAQFSSRSNAMMISGPVNFRPKYLPSLHVVLPLPTAHSFLAGAEFSRSFHGMGPSVYWDESVPVAGDPSGSQLVVDWGLNAAVLFGRQKVRGSHQQTEHYHTALMTTPPQTTPYAHATPVSRSHSVVVPNVGGFAGLSMKFPNAKVSFGYRADFFFGAMDGGVDTRKTYDRNFFGPFATISFGLGG